MQRTAFEIGRVAGVRIRVDVTFLLVLPFLAWSLARGLPEAARMSGISADRIAGPAWAWGAALALVLFASVLLHELSHCWWLARAGGRARSITLLMIGGVTEAEEPPRDPRREAGIALAGPAASLVLGLAAVGLAPLATRLEAPSAAFALSFVGRLNLALGVFNLLPAFPMDGGRVLRGLLLRRRSAVEATRVAANLGKAFAAAFAAFGFVTANLILILVAFFVFVGATAEEQQVLVRAVLGDLRVREIMTGAPITVSAGDTLFDAAEKMLRGRRVALPVCEQDRVVGFLRLGAVERIPAEARRAATVRDAMDPARVVAPEDRVVDAMKLLGPGASDHLAVAEEGTLVGVLSSFDVQRGLRLRKLAQSQVMSGPRVPSKG